MINTPIDIYIPEIRIAAAKHAIIQLSENFDQTTTLGIAGFGSFWSAEIKRKPNDMDLAIFTNNDAEFIHGDRIALMELLRKQFHVDIETHILTPYTPSVKNELENYRILLKDSILLWGRMPSWIN